MIVRWVHFAYQSFKSADLEDSHIICGRNRLYMQLFMGHNNLSGAVVGRGLNLYCQWKTRKQEKENPGRFISRTCVPMDFVTRYILCPIHTSHIAKSFVLQEKTNQTRVSTCVLSKFAPFVIYYTASLRSALMPRLWAAPIIQNKVTWHMGIFLS